MINNGVVPVVHHTILLLIPPPPLFPFHKKWIESKKRLGGKTAFIVKRVTDEAECGK